MIILEDCLGVGEGHTVFCLIGFRFKERVENNFCRLPSSCRCRRAAQLRPDAERRNEGFRSWCGGYQNREINAGLFLIAVRLEFVEKNIHGEIRVVRAGRRQIDGPGGVWKVSFYARTSYDMTVDVCEPA